MINSNNCTGCSACAIKCPQRAIMMSENNYGFISAYIDNTKCIKCNICDTLCHNNTDPFFSLKNSLSFAAINTNENIRQTSSSGGVFSALANYVISNGGVVFGASYSNEFEVEHIGINKKCDLHKLVGSKYVQSKVGECYFLAEEFLKQGKMVLFSGVPCQIAGLYRYLGKDYSNLLTVDLICHGLSSRKIWRDYYNKLSKRKKISGISFRDKATGWHKFSFSIEYKRKKVYRFFIDDPFCFFFDSHYILNEKCFNCKYSYANHSADITLGDLWGIENFQELEDDNIGTSLVFLNTQNAKEIFSQIQQIKETAIDGQKALRFNMHEPAHKPIKYDDFWKLYTNKGLDETIKRYFFYSNKRRIKIYAKRIFAAIPVFRKIIIKKH